MTISRFWARSYLGWSFFKAHLPNINHHVLSDWEKKGRVHWLVTQNVDNLHFAAGSERVSELHGSTHRVICMRCDTLHDRELIQHVIDMENPDFFAEIFGYAPDGDVDLRDSDVVNFQPPSCPSCGKRSLRPHVVFFGDNVPQTIVKRVVQVTSEADAVLVLGTSLQTFSSFRIVRQAFDEGTPVFAVNIGPTRADKLFSDKIVARCSDVVPKVEFV